MVTPVDALLNNSVTGSGFSADCASRPVCQDSGWGDGEGGSPFPRAFGPAQACPQESALAIRKDDLEKRAGASRLASRERQKATFLQGTWRLLPSMAIQLVLGSGEKV